MDLFRWLLRYSSQAFAVLLTWVGRLVAFRFALIVLCGPALIVLASHLAPSMLYGVLIMRGSPLGSPEYFRDLSNVTWISLLTTALGIALVRLILLNGKARFGWSDRHMRGICLYECVRRIGFWIRWWERCLGRDKVVFFWSPNVRGWPITILLVWLLVGLSYPWACRQASCHEHLRAQVVAGVSEQDYSFALNQIPDRLQALDVWQTGGNAMVAGLFMAALCLLLFASARLLWAVVFRHPILPTGMILWEGCLYVFAQRFTEKDVPPSSSDGTLVSKHRQQRWKGFYDFQHQRWRPGHLQIFVTTGISLLVYGVAFFLALQDTSWSNYRFTAGFYILVLVYWLGAILTGVGFALDRFRVPVVAMAALYLAFLAFTPIEDHDRYFQLVYVPESTTGQTPPAATPTTNVYRKALDQRPAQSEQYPDPPYLIDVYEGYHFPIGLHGKRTLVVVTASGGGIQASAWSAQVLTGLGERIPWFDQSVGLISSVSGGSVGVLHYLGHRGVRAPSGDLMILDEDAREKIQHTASASSLEAVSWGVAFPDLVRSILPLKWLRSELDRGYALESSWWNRMGAGPEDRALMKDLRLRDLTQLTLDHAMPPVIFNATTVETGQRVLISPVRTSSVAPPEAASPGDGTSTSPDTYATTDVPIDFLEYYGGVFKNPKVVNPRLSTAVRLSATFAYVTPAARPLPIDMAQLRQNSLDGSDQPLLPADRAALANRLDLHLVDGGYSDNAGLVTAVKLCHQLVRALYSRAATDPEYKLPFEQILFVRIEPFPPSRTQIVSNNSGLRNALFAPSTTLNSARVTTQAERGDLEMDLLIAATKDEFLRLSRKLEEELVASYLSLIVYANAQAPFLEEPIFETDDYPVLADWLDRLPGMNLGANFDPNQTSFSNVYNALRERIQDGSVPEPEAVEQALAEASQQHAQLGTALARLQERERLCLRQFSTYDNFQTSHLEIKTLLCQFGESPDPAKDIIRELASQLDSPSTAAAADEAEQQASLREARRLFGDPPLSWLLSPSDIAMLDYSWKKIDRGFEPPDMIGAAGGEATASTAVASKADYRQDITPSLAGSIISPEDMLRTTDGK